MNDECPICGAYMQAGVCPYPMNSTHVIATLRGQVSALRSRVERMQGVVDAAKTAIAAAAVPLEVIAGQHRVEPYRELSPELITSIDEAIVKIRFTLASLAEKENP